LLRNLLTWKRLQSAVDMVASFRTPCGRGGQTIVEE
jgi:hypothetical protein